MDDKIAEYVKANGIMTLATVKNNEPWVCTLYYGTDEELNLFVVTDPNSIHGQQIRDGSVVAFNIFDSHQPITKLKKGVQGKGQIKKLTYLAEITKGLWLWHKANTGVEEKITVKDILKKLTDTKVYKIKPTYLKFFNKELYGKEQYGVWEV